MNTGDDSTKKPYRRVYRGGGRRRSLDDELGGLRPPRGGEAARPAPAEAGVTPGGRPQTVPPVSPAAQPAGPPRPYRRYEAGGAAAAGATAAGGARSAPSTAARSVSRSSARPTGRRRFRWWHVPLALFTLLVIAGVVLTVLAYPGYKKFDEAVAKSNARLDGKTRSALTPDDGMILRNPTTILVLGTDSRLGEPARSDTIMLMRFDPDSHTVNQLSIPRDTKVDVPGRGTMKINEAMFWGGPSLAVKTVSDYVGIPINHVMVVSFQGFWRVTHAVGGVDMYVPETISTEAGGRGRIFTFTKGWHHFSAKQAMIYVRIRHVDNDFKRAERQQAFVRALQKKIAQPSNITKLPDVGRRFMNGVDTDLTTTQLLQLGWVKWRADDKKGKHWVLAGAPAYIGGVSYVLPPADAKKARIVERFLGG